MEKYQSTENPNNDFEIRYNAKDTLDIEDKLDYFKNLADYYSKIVEPSSPVNILNSIYNRIGTINTESVCCDYFNGILTEKEGLTTYLFPFSFNISQRQAVINAFTNNISVVEGPPGCGKTQTILNIIANIVMNNKTVAVVSNNNSAIENIVEKLEKEGLGFFTALLGNTANKEKFFTDNQNESLKKFITTYKSIAKKKTYSPKEYVDILSRLYEEENKLKILTLKKSNLQKEFEHFQIEKPNVIKIDLNPNYSSSTYIGWKAFFESSNTGGLIKWIHKLIIRIKLNILTKRVAIVDLIDNLEQCYYINKLKEIEKEINKIQLSLSGRNFTSLQEEYKNVSLTIFRDELFKKYHHLPEKKFSAISFRHEFEDFLKRYPVILSTSHSILNSIDKGMLLDYIIFDEASQSDLLSSVLALMCAKNLIVIGDSQQLKEIESEDIYHKSDNLAKAYNITLPYQYKNNSILSSVKGVFGKQLPTVLLREHYRCHPKIINFCNENFYNGELIIMTQEHGDSPFEVIYTVKGNHGRRDKKNGRYNQREIDEVKKYLQDTTEDTGIITPFNHQTNLLKKEFTKYFNVEVNTVHKFQGRQKDIIVLSTVLNTLKKDSLYKNKVSDFVNQKELLNVAVSRAVKKLVVITSEKIFNGDHTIVNDLIGYIQYHTDSKYIKKGEIVSIFDVLYSDYQQERDKLLKRYEKDRYISEIVMEKLLNKILLQFPKYKYQMHVCLNNIISKEILNDTSRFSYTERKYLNHPRTHVDFLIFNKITKKTEFVIEVNGIKYHDHDEKQTIHDKYKNKAFNIAGIPIYTVKTNGSGEEGKLIEYFNYTYHP